MRALEARRVLVFAAAPERDRWGVLLAAKPIMAVAARPDRRGVMACATVASVGSGWVVARDVAATAASVAAEVECGLGRR